MIVEDDKIISSELKNILYANGYLAEIAEDLKNVIEVIKQINPQLLLLDINLPYTDGFQICSQVRTFSNMPIIFVTSRNTDMDELNSIMLGGDAFITKPYNIPILLAKISSLLKRAYPNIFEETINHKNAVLHIENNTLEHNNMKIEFTKNEFRILYYLFKNADKICKRADIIEYLWDNQMYVDDNTLSVNITRIRDKLNSIGLNDFIKTKHRQGYII